MLILDKGRVEVFAVRFENQGPDFVKLSSVLESALGFHHAKGRDGEAISFVFHYYSTDKECCDLVDHESWAL